MIGTIQNREAFLNKLSGRLGRERRTEVERPEWKFNPQDEVLKGATQDELVDVLREQCKNIHTNFVLTTSAELSASINEVIDNYGGGPIVSWKDERFEQFGLTNLMKQEWPEKGIELHEWDHTIGQENIEKANYANVGITISDITLAESGTAVLFSGKDKGRTVSFLPATSIILVPKSSIVPRMTQAAQIIREKVANGEQVASCVNFITGPSNSADIEMILVVGVHGPIKATYIVIGDM
ncbi:lactate utilization protein C [Robertmurraya yapensis]|uniref:Lactate utilization protein C n=2 Tax=Bacillaceae TaxID=186817 RepID=A0A431WA25_9BACI|nr:lactate utilization protein C [Bacillus yapensis]RTR32330.1 lactate utilization protein C [Bacillus yapensis]TKS96524.1 lactate utilization protein C [Bacillus yapensis]